MAVIQTSFEIPALIQQGLIDGTLIRYGGVVRDQAGHIVTHLKEIPVSVSKKNKYLLVGTLFFCVAGGLAGMAYAHFRHKKAPKYVDGFNESFTEYINSIEKGNLSEKEINKLIQSLNEIKRNQEDGDISIVFSSENFQLLQNLVRDYTIKLADANSYDVPDTIPKSENGIINLQHYLEIQKHVFEKCG